jgi:hypothetical protein
MAYPGFKTEKISFVRQPRNIGKAKQSPKKLVSLATDALFSITNLPLTLIISLATLTSICAITCMVYILWKALLSEIPIPGYASSVLITLIIGSVNLISIAIIGEYLRRINNEVKKRPQYFIAGVRQYNGNQLSDPFK